MPPATWFPRPPVQRRPGIPHLVGEGSPEGLLQPPQQARPYRVVVLFPHPYARLRPATPSSAGTTHSNRSGDATAVTIICISSRPCSARALLKQLLHRRLHLEQPAAKTGGPSSEIGLISRSASPPSLPAGAELIPNRSFLVILLSAELGQCRSAAPPALKSTDPALLAKPDPANAGRNFPSPEEIPHPESSSFEWGIFNRRLGILRPALTIRHPGLRRRRPSLPSAGRSKARRLRWLARFGPEIHHSFRRQTSGRCESPQNWSG
jgi:hypothetical protein